MQTTNTNFSTLSLSPEMLQNLDKIAYTSMTPIQANTLPHILQGKDIIAEAKTGSGKTAAFGIGILSTLDVKKFRVQSLILCPTRELADQVARELRNIAKFAHNIKILTLCGGTAFGPQYGSLQHGAHIIVGTPGRVLKHLKKDSLNLKDIKTLILDEADRMLDMGFMEEISEVLDFAPKERQILLFSATYTDEVLDISQTIQKDAIHVKTAEIELKNKIDEIFYNTNEREKLHTLIKILAQYNPTNAIVFTNTKLKADEITDAMQNKEMDALALHGDLEQYDRNDVLVQFANKSCRVLVATDVAARGLDIKELAMVINYDLPHTLEIYTHRIGRTARAGATGIAISLYTNIEDEQEFAGENKEFLDSSNLQEPKNFNMLSEYVTLVIEGGKKDKLRAGDILGALTGDQGLAGSSIGKIDVYERQSYVAIERKMIENAYEYLKNGKIKTKKFSVWIL